jgi:hypothetical protein
MGQWERTLAPALIAGALVALPGAAAAQRTFFVDFAGGNDNANGLSQQTAFRRAPGDPLATGVAAATRLGPGDRVVFRGGVRYRGQIEHRRDGTATQPIIYDGSGWGNVKAIMDGGTALGQAQPCPSQAACLGTPAWRRAMMVRLPADTRWTDWLFFGDQPLQIAQWPAVDRYWNYDDVSQFVAVPQAHLADVRAGFLPVRGVPARLQSGTPVLGLWHAENDIHFARQFTIAPDGVRFTVPEDYVPYTRRDNRFTVYNAPSEVDQPGEFAISESDGIAVFIPPATALRSPTLSVGSRRAGFLIRGTRQHAHIRGFSFTNFAAEEMGTSNMRAGNPIYSDASTTGFRVTDNDFRAIVSMRRMGAVRFVHSRDLEVKRNSFDSMPWATAIYVGDSPGPIRVQCNRISNIGRNGIRMLSVLDGLVAGNRLSGVNGIHGAAINGYIDNRDLTIRDNVVTESERAVTLHGARNPVHADPRPQNIVIAGNTFLTEAVEGGAAISSWGLGITGLRIERNLLAGSRNAMRFAGNETGVSVSNNQIVGAIAKPRGFEIPMVGNQFFDPQGNGAQVVESARNRTPPADYCA